MMPFFDYVYTLPNQTTGVDSIVVGTVGAVPSFTPLLLLFVFMFVFLGGVMRQKARLGDSDYAVWAVIASLSTLMVSLILSTITGIISLDILVIVVVVTIFSGVWLFLQRRQGLV